MEGLEPTRLTAPDPKSGMATNYITSANEHCSFFDECKYKYFFHIKPSFFLDILNFPKIHPELSFYLHFYYFYPLNEFISWNYKEQ